MKKTFALILTLALVVFTLAACGSSNSAIELTIPELERYSGYEAWVDVCKDWA